MPNEERKTKTVVAVKKWPNDVIEKALKSGMYKDTLEMNPRKAFNENNHGEDLILDLSALNDIGRDDEIVSIANITVITYYCAW